MICPKCGKTRQLRVSEAKLNTTGYCATCPRVYDLTIPDNYESGYVVGAMLGDGHLFYNRKRRANHSLRLEVTSKAFAEKFASCVNQIIPGKPAWMKKYTKLKKAVPSIQMPECIIDVFIVIKYSKEWFEKVSVIKNQKGYAGIKEYSVSFASGFVDGFLDAEGYVSTQFGYTDFANKDLDLLGLAQHFLSRLGITSKIQKMQTYARGVSHLRVLAPLQKTA